MHGENRLAFETQSPGLVGFKDGFWGGSASTLIPKVNFKVKQEECSRIGEAAEHVPPKAAIFGINFIYSAPLSHPRLISLWSRACPTPSAGLLKKSPNAWP